MAASACGVLGPSGFFSFGISERAAEGPVVDLQVPRDAPQKKSRQNKKNRRAQHHRRRRIHPGAQRAELLLEPLGLEALLGAANGAFDGTFDGTFAGAFDRS